MNTKDFIDPDLQDFLLTDELTSEDLSGAISDLLGVEYLSEASAAQLDQLSSCAVGDSMYSPNRRLLINLTCSIQIATGSWASTICNKDAQSQIPNSASILPPAMQVDCVWTTSIWHCKFLNHRKPTVAQAYANRVLSSINDESKVGWNEHSFVIRTDIRENVEVLACRNRSTACISRRSGGRLVLHG